MSRRLPFAVVATCFMLAAGTVRAADPQSSDAARQQFDGAVALHKGGAYDLAADEWEKFLQKFPDDPLAAQAQFFDGVCYLSLPDKQYDKARAAFENVVAKYPKFEQLDKAYFNLGLADYNLAQSGKTDLHPKAAAAFGELIKKFPNSPQVPEALLYRGESLYAIGKKEEAVKSWSDLAAKHSDNPARARGLYNLGIAEQELGHQEKAAAAFDTFLKDFPKHELAAEIEIRKLDSLMAADRFADAEKQFAAAAARKDFALADYATFRQGAALAGQKKFSEAAAVYAKLPEKFPKSSYVGAATLAAGNCYYLAGNQSEARNWLGRAQAAGGEPAIEAAHWIARSWLKDKQPKEAMAVVEKALPQADNSSHRTELLADEADAMSLSAAAFLDAKDYAAADKLYQRLVEKFPNDPDAERWLVCRGLMRYLQKNYTDTISNLKPQINKLKTPDRKAEAQFLIGSSQLELKQYGDAIKSLAASVSASPKAPQTDETLLALATAQRAAGDADAARKTMKKLADDYPDSKQLDRAHFRLADWQFEAGDFTAAAGEYQWIVDHAAGSSLVPNALVGLGWSQLNKSDFAAAAKTFSTVLEKYPSHALASRARYGRAAARQQLKEFSGAAADVEAYLKADPKSAERTDALYVLGLAQEGEKKFSDAAHTFESLLTADPKYAGADKVLYELAWSHKSANQEDAAAEAFGRLAREHGDSPLAAESWFNVGEFQYHQKKDFKAAADAYSATVAKAGRGDLSEKAGHKLGWAWFQLPDYAKAQQAFAAQLSDYPQGSLAADAAFMLGECAFKQDKFETALAAFQKAITMKSSSADFAALSLLHAGQAAGQLKKWDESLKLLEKLTKEYPDSPHAVEALYEQGWAKQNLGRLDEALKLYETVSDKTQAVVGARARFMMGEVLFEQGNHKEAIRNFFKVAYGYGDTQAAAPYHVWQANATFEAARCFEVLKSTEQAKKLYNELLTKYPESDKVSSAKKRLAQLGSP